MVCAAMRSEAQGDTHDMEQSVSDSLWLLAGFLVAAGCSTYLVRRLAWPSIQRIKGVVIAVTLTGFLALFVLSLLPAAYMAGVSFALLERVGWPIQAGFYVASLTTVLVTAPLTLLLVLAVARAVDLVMVRTTAPRE